MAYALIATFLLDIGSIPIEGVQTMKETKWTTDKDRFKAAMENEEYAEFQLDENHVLIKDVGSPLYIVAQNVENPEEHEQFVDDLLVDEAPFVGERYVFYDEGNSQGMKEGCYLYDVQ